MKPELQRTSILGMYAFFVSVNHVTVGLITKPRGKPALWRAQAYTNNVPVTGAVRVGTKQAAIDYVVEHGGK